MHPPRFATFTAMLLALAACGRPQGDPEPQSPPQPFSNSGAGAKERKKIGNLQGLGHRSRVTFVSYPDRPHQLELSFAFPDRARSQLRPDGARSAQRALNYRFGHQLWSIQPGKKESSELTGVHAAEAVLEFELRRALFLWPLGFEWTSAGENRLRAEVVDFGHLEAVLGGDTPNLPIQMEAFDTEDQERESFRNVIWIEGAERTQPASFDVYLRGGLVWEEEVLEVDVQSRFLDAWFIPADQREITRGQAVKSCVPFELGHLDFQRQTLPPNTTLTEAITEAEHQMALSDEILSPSPHVELTTAGTPKAIWLVRANSSESPAPPGWIGLEGGPALSRFLPAPTLSPTDLVELRAASGGTPRALFLRIQPNGSIPRRAELVWVSAFSIREH